MVPIVLFLLILLTSTPSWATRYWVATTGSDSNSCASVSGDADPGVYRLTPLNGSSCLTTAGDRLTIKAGTYSGTTARIISIPSGTAANPTIIEGDPNDSTGCALASNCSTVFVPSGSGLNTAISSSHWIMRKIEIDATSASRGAFPLYVKTPATDVLIEDVEVHGTIEATASSVSCTASDNGASFITWRRMHVYDCGNMDRLNGSPDHGGYLSATDQVIEYGSWHDNAYTGFQCYSSVAGTASDRCIIRGNKVYNNGGDGIDYEGNDGQIYNNLIYSNGSNGLVVGFSPALRTKIINNVIVNNNTRNIGAKGINVGAYGDASNSSVQNNVFFGHSGEVTITTTHGTASVTTSYNACTAASSCGTTGKLTITALTDIFASSSDYRLKAGSTAIDAGIDVGLPYNGTAPDIGAFESIRVLSCQVPNGAASTIQVTFETNAFPPLLPSSGATTFTARKNGASNAVNGTVTRVGDGIFSIPLTNTYVGGDTADLSWASGNITDSAGVGGTIYQQLVTAFTNLSCTNNAGGAPTYTFTQSRYEFHYTRGLENAPIMLPHGYANSGAAENYSAITLYPGGSVRIRFAIVCGVSNCPDTAFYLYYSNGGAYAVVPNTYGAGTVAFCGTPSGTDMPSNGSATTDQLSIGGTFIPGGIIFTSSAIPTISGLNTGYKTELEYCVVFSSSASGNYDFRVYQQDGTALNTYTVTPRVTITNVAAGGAGF